MQGAYDPFNATPIFINHQEAWENWKMYLRGDIEYSVGKFLQDLVEEGDYTFNVHNSPIKMKDEFIRTFEEEWLPLRKEFYEDLLCLGLVVLKYNDKWSAPRNITRAIGKRFAISIQYNARTMQLDYHYVDIRKYLPYSKNKPTGKIIIIRAGYDPLPDGSLTCPMSHLRRQTEYTLLNYHWHMQGTNILSKPEIMLRTEKDKIGLRQGESLAMLDFESLTMKKKYHETDVDTNRIQRLMEKRAQDNQAVIQSSLTMQISDSEKLVLNKPELREKQSSTVISVPTDGPINYHLPQVRNDWEIMHRILYEIVSAVFGIPAQYVTSLGVKYARAGGQLEMSDKRLAKTVNSWRNRLQYIFTTVYAFRFGTIPPIQISFSRYHREEYALLKEKYLDGILMKHEFVNMIRSEMGLPTLLPEEIEKLTHIKSEESRKDEEKKKDDESGTKKRKKDDESGEEKKKKKT